jgi:hypothetical protein
LRQGSALSQQPFYLNFTKILKMDVITIHTDNENQTDLLRALLNELKIKFETNHTETLTDLQKEKIQKGINDIEIGRFSTSKTVQKRVKECFK